MTMDPANLLRMVPHCMLAEQHSLRSRLRSLGRARDEGRRVEGPLNRIAAEVERSMDRRRRRAAAVPAVTFPADLPVAGRRDEIAQAIASHQVVVLCGETGSGKTTQLPKICLQLGQGVGGVIGHTQPRRIAARSVAARIAQELGRPLGSIVGYKVRFDEKLSDETAVKLMTDGILLAEMQTDRWLSQYDTIIIDEAHERSLNIDFLMGYLKRLLPRRPELKLIITSATIDPARFSRHFGGAPIIEVSGRTYAVEVRYSPLAGDDSGEEPDLVGGIVEAIRRIVGEEVRASPRSNPHPNPHPDPLPEYREREKERERARDILVFLATEREIRETAEAIRKLRLRDVDVLPLYARLGTDEQMRVFSPHRGRRIVLATNVAETSLTVPGIGYVVDPGLARISRYSSRTRVQRLPIERVSRASADQRKGRCGRVSEGVCIRLYSQSDYDSRPQFTDPEILRTNLASVILQMKAYGLGEIQDFGFIDPPDYRAVRDGFATLHELGAIDETNELTPTGRQLARLPVDPRLGRMILSARQQGCLRDVLIIAAALGVQDPRLRPADKAEAADAAHAAWRDADSDFLSFLKLWRALGEQSRELGAGKLRAWCRDSFLSYSRLREWQDVHRQLLEMSAELEREGNKPRG